LKPLVAEVNAVIYNIRNLQDFLIRFICFFVYHITFSKLFMMAEATELPMDL